MAVTKLWPIKGRLRQVLTYIKNPEKTVSCETETNELEAVIDYAVDSNKTEFVDGENEVIKSFVSGINCSPELATHEMMAVKKRFSKESDPVAYHGYQSFAPGEATPEIAHEISVKLARRLWGSRYQVVVATHLDKTNHLHSHFVINTVSFVDGIRFHSTAKDYHDMRAESDDLCLQYGLSIIEEPHYGRTKHYAEWRAEKEQRPTWRGLIRKDVDDAIDAAITEKQFFYNLVSLGYEIRNDRKDISVKPPGKQSFVRLCRNFGEEYSREVIRDRILLNERRKVLVPDIQRKNKYARYRGNEKPRKKATGFRALYLHYCYLLGYLPKSKPKSNKRLHFLLREDLIKMDEISKEARLLASNKIDTDEQLSSYKQSLNSKIDGLSTKRKELYNRKRSRSVKNVPEKLKNINDEISEISKELSKTKKEVKLCEQIEIRSEVMKEKIKTIKKEENQKKEMKQHEYGRFR